MGYDIYIAWVLKGTRACSMERESPSSNRASLLTGDICQELLCPSDTESFLGSILLWIGNTPQSLAHRDCCETLRSGIYLGVGGWWWQEATSSPPSLLPRHHEVSICALHVPLTPNDVGSQQWWGQVVMSWGLWNCEPTQTFLPFKLFVRYLSQQ